MSPADAELHAALLGRLERELHTLPDKPEESARSALHALWHLAMGHALSADAALEHELPSLNDGAVRQLRMLVDQRLTGTPLAHGSRNAQRPAGADSAARERAAGACSRRLAEAAGKARPHAARARCLHR